MEENMNLISKEELVDEIVQLLATDFDVSEEGIEELLKQPIGDLVELRDDLLKIEGDFDYEDDEESEECDCVSDKVADDPEVLMGIIQVEEELKRIEKQDGEYVNEDLTAENSDVILEVMEETVAICNSFKELMRCGVDYANAISISNNIVVGIGQRKLAKINAEVQQNNAY